MKLSSVYPYTYGRVAAMRSELLPSDRYSQMLKMSLSELTQFLQGTTYKTEVDTHALHSHGAALIDVAVQDHLGKVAAKLRRISEEGLRQVIDAYLQRRESHNAKTLIRGMIARFPFDRIRLHLMEGSTAIEKYKERYEKGSVDSVISSLQFIRNPARMIAEFAQTKDLFRLEARIDEAYYQYMLGFARNLPVQGDVMRQFIMEEVRFKNLMTVLRMRRAGVPSEQIQTWLYFPNPAEAHYFSRLLAYPETRNAQMAFKDKVADRDVKKALELDSVSAVEIALMKYLLRRMARRTHQNPLSVDVILSYLFAVEIEARNLKILAKAKEAGLPEARVQELLI
ncbi:MAG TPA: V-type ATPase subunit [Candidatus Nanoarchaeia archaeon]|nr:V-type ATPase subunit [Candidatus Nanoarchaeia archaeon]